MKTFRIPRLLPLIGIFTAIVGLAPAAPADEIDIAVNALKACVEPKIAAERANEKPSADALLRACSSEFLKAKDSVPSAVREQIAEQIRHDIQERLGADAN